MKSMILFILGLTVVAGAVGGSDAGTATWSQVIAFAAVGFTMIVLSLPGLMVQAYDEE